MKRGLIQLSYSIWIGINFRIFKIAPPFSGNRTYDEKKSQVRSLQKTAMFIKHQPTLSFYSSSIGQRIRHIYKKEGRHHDDQSSNFKNLIP